MMQWSSHSERLRSETIIPRAGDCRIEICSQTDDVSRAVMISFYCASHSRFAVRSKGETAEQTPYRMLTRAPGFDEVVRPASFSGANYDGRRLR
jgi:hypothetical protein